MADVVTEGCVMAAAHRLSILWKQKWDTKLTDVLKCFGGFFVVVLSFYFFKAKRLYGKCRLKFGRLQTFLRSYS